MNLEPIWKLIALAEAYQQQVEAGDGAYPSEAFDVCNKACDSIPALSELLEAVTWIKCSERMPEPGPHVWALCTRAAWWQQQAYVDEHGKWRSGSFCPTCGFMGGDFIVGEVTHWMPLPSSRGQIMNTPEIAKCPNPECRKPCKVQTRVLVKGDEPMYSRVQCAACGYKGPHHVFAEYPNGKEEKRAILDEAIRLHNAICRQPTPEAAETESATQAAKRLGYFSMVKAKSYNADVPDELFRGFIAGYEAGLVAHPPKPEPTEPGANRVAKVLQESIARVRPLVLSEREGESVTGEVMNMILNGSECPCCYGKGKIPEDAPNATVAYLIGLSRSVAHPPKPEPTPEAADTVYVYACPFCNEYKDGPTSLREHLLTCDVFSDAACGAPLLFVIQRRGRIIPQHYMLRANAELAVNNHGGTIIPVYHHPAHPPKPEPTEARELNLKWGRHDGRGEYHIEWHAPCGCAYHPEPKPHVHPCIKHGPIEPGYATTTMFAKLKALVEEIRLPCNQDGCAEWAADKLEAAIFEMEESPRSPIPQDLEGRVKELEEQWHRDFDNTPSQWAADALTKLLKATP